MEAQNECYLDMTDEVVKNIYSSCDEANNDAVHVSKIINFIKPFMEENFSELQELKYLLDTDNTNPCISSQQFFKAMAEWTGKLKGDGAFTDNTCLEINPNTLNHDVKDQHFLQSSTPRASLGDHLLKGCGRTIPDLNFSNVSAYSITDSNVPLTLDASSLEEKVKELEHLLNRANTENELLRQQLVFIEEQNESLQGELNDVKKNLVIEQQTVDVLQKEKKELEELKEELSIARKDIEYHRNNYMNSEKRVHHLNSWIKQLEEEKTNTEKKSVKTIGSSLNLKREVTDLQCELAEKYTEISELERDICKVKEQLNEKEECIDHLKKTNELLKHENSTFKTSRSFVKKYDSPFEFYQTANSQFTFSCNFDRTKLSKLHRGDDYLKSISPNSYNSSSQVFYTSPKLLNKLAHPVTPINSPMVDNMPGRKPLGSDEFSPILQQKESLLKNVLTKHTSTPDQKQDNLIILDSSLPADSKIIPVMDFTKTQHSDPGVYQYSKMDVENLILSSSMPTSHNVNTCLNQSMLNTSLNVSSDEDLYCKLPFHSVSNSEVPGESLQIEIVQATTASLKDKDIMINDLVNKLKEHDNCSFIINAYKNEISLLKVQLSKYDGSLEICEKCIKHDEEIRDLKLQIERTTVAKDILYERLKVEFDNAKHLEDVFKEKINLEDALAKEREYNRTLQKETADYTVQLEELTLKHEDTIAQYSEKMERMRLAVENEKQTVSELRCVLQQKSNEILILSERIEESDSQHNELLSEHEAQIESLHSLVESLKNSNLEKVQEISRLWLELENEIEVKKCIWKSVQELRLELSAKDLSNSKCNELENSYSELEASYIKLEASYKELVEKCHNLELDYSKLKEDYIELSQECNNFKDTNDELMVVKSELENVQKSQKEAINNLLQDITVSKSDLEICIREKNAYEKELDTIKHTVRKANDDNKSLTDEITELETKNSALIKKLDDLENGMQCEREVKNNIFKECETLRLQLKEEQDKCCNYKNQLKSIESSLKNVVHKQKTGEKPDEISVSVIDHNVTEAIDQLHFVIETLTTESEIMRDSIGLLHEENDEMKKAIQLMEIQLNEKQAQYQNEMSSEKFKYNKLQVEFAELMGKYDASERNLKHSKSKIGTVKKNNTILQQNRDALCKDRTELQESVTELKQGIEELHSELHGLKSQMEQERRDHNLSRFHFETEITKLMNENRTIHIAYEELMRRLKQEEKLFGEQRDKFMKEKHCLEKNIQREEQRNMDLRRSMADMSATNTAANKKLEDFNVEQSKLVKDLKYRLECQKLEVIGATDLLQRVLKNIGTSRINLLGSLVSLTSNLKILFNVPNELLDDKHEDEAVNHISTIKSPKNEALIEEETSKLNKYINIIGKISEYMATISPKSLQQAEVQTDSVDKQLSLTVQQKPLNKFTLRPSKLIVSCPASPDSPSNFEGVLATDAELDNNIDKVFSSVQNTSEVADTVLENKDEKILSDDMNPQPAFPNQPDTFLESLGLLEESPRKALSKGEMEEKFTALVLTWTLDKESVKSRYQKQHAVREQFIREVVEQLNQAATLLLGHSCPKSAETVLPAVDQLELVKQSLEKVFAVVEQYGVLLYELRNTRCWNLVVNYVASLKQEIDSKKALSPSIERPLQLKKPEIRTTGTTMELRNRKQPNFKRLQITTHKGEFVCSNEKKGVSAVFFRYLMTPLIITLSFIIMYALISALN